MSDEYLDDNGYPTEEALNMLTHWSCNDIQGALEFMKSLWWPNSNCVHNELRPDEASVVGVDRSEDRIFYRFATGGWSGNESLIAAFQGDHLTPDVDCTLEQFINAMIRGSRSWHLHARGGLYIYSARK